ncbi:MAG: hypothetical protein IMZ44_23645 [Planctomycetes bacterium]|nr:hypothetical protein [Planctomycetota bacterium]
MSQPASGGGAAGAAGFGYQHRVAAWFAVNVLAEQGWSPVCRLPSGTTLEGIQCESREATDDVLVHTSRDGHLLGQVKRSLHLSARSDSPFASAVAQFVRQFHDGITAGTSQRGLEETRDRLILVVSAHCSGTVRVTLRDVLDRVRDLPAGVPLSDVANNASERKALRQIVRCVQDAWRTNVGADPSEGDIRWVLRLVHVLCLDVEASGADENTSKVLLRNAVLRDPTRADDAWNLLLSACTDAAKSRLPMDRLTLHAAFKRAEIDLCGVRSYWDRIAGLSQRSQDTLTLTTDMARIRVGAADVKLDRTCTAVLRQAAEQGSLLVVGEPGAGKSGVLHDLVEGLLHDGQDVVYLTAEWAGDLGRDTVEVLRNWPGNRPGFLVIDALDSVRSEQSGPVLRDILALIMGQESRWHVVASVRSYDLRHSQSLQARFKGSPCSDDPVFRNDEFASVRHLGVPRLQPEEWDSIRAQSQLLAGLVGCAPSAFRELLDNLFNLSLVAELVWLNVPEAELTAIRTQIGLLDRYWQHRVIDEDGQGNARESLLCHAAEEMVRTRTLRANRANLLPHASGNSLHDIESRNILKPCSPSGVGAAVPEVLEFAHHVLFDYAVARLLFRGMPDRLIQRVTQDPVIALTVQPSLRMHFQHLWYAVGGSHDCFWDATFAVARAPNIPDIARLVGPAVAADLATASADLERLCSALINAGDADTAEAAAQAFDHLVGALLASAPTARPLVGEGAGPWCDLLQRVAESNGVAGITGPAISLLSQACESPELLTPEQRDAAGRAARALMRFAMTRGPRNEWSVINSCRAVCRTFATDPVSSAGLIRGGLDEANAYAPHELYWLTYEIERLIPHDPALVEQIYEFAFCRPKPAPGTAPRVTSRILPLSFAADQEWGMCQFHLVNAFPRFLRTASAHATRAVIRAVQFYDDERSAGHQPEQPATFDFFGREARILTDYSHIWNRGYDQHDALSLLGHFESYLDEIGSVEPESPVIGQIIDTIVQSNQMAVFWRALLHAGAQRTRTIGLAIRPLAWARPILNCYDTVLEMGGYLHAVYPHLGESDRARIEETVLSLPEGAPSEHRESLEYVMNGLLRSVPPDCLVTEAAKNRLSQLPGAQALQFAPPAAAEFVEAGAFTAPSYLERLGVPVGEPANRQVMELVEPVEAFRSKPVEEAMAPHAVESVRGQMRLLRESLDHAEASDVVHAETKEYGWDHLASACARICRVDDPVPIADLVHFAGETLLAASQRRNPQARDDDNAKFDESVGWGSPAARIEAAEGLMFLARHAGYVNADVRDAIRRLGLADPRAAVRLQVAERLLFLYRTDQNLMWNLAERMVADEGSQGVLEFLVHCAFWQLAELHADRVVDLTRAILGRATDGRRADQLRGECIALLFDHCIGREHPAACEIIERIIQDPAGSDGAATVVARLRRLVTLGATDSPDAQHEAIRGRAWSVLERVTRRLCEQCDRLLAEHQRPGTQWSEEDQRRIQRILQLLDNVSAQVYFASGAFQSDREPDEEPLTPAQRVRFFREAGRVFDMLADVGYPSITHHLLQTLEAFVANAPKEVFLTVGRAVAAGKPGGYQFESMGADLIVKVVERYFAEHRQLVQEDTECRETLLRVIDTFVRAGWPSARRLVYRLEDVFR